MAKAANARKKKKILLTFHFSTCKENSAKKQTMSVFKKYFMKNGRLYFFYFVSEQPDSRFRGLLNY